MQATPAGDAQAEWTLKDFLCWYNDNRSSLNALRFVRPLRGNGAYSVDFAATERWLRSLRESGFVSEAFVAHWRAYFENAEKSLRKDSVSDGPAAGFEFDFVYDSQEDPPANADIRNAAIVMRAISDGRLTIVLDVPNFGRVTKILVRSADARWRLAQ